MTFAGIREIITPIKTPVGLPGAGPAHIEDLFPLLIIQCLVKPVVRNMRAFRERQSCFVSPPGADGGDIVVGRGPGRDLQQNLLGRPGIFVLLAHEKRQRKIHQSAIHVASEVRKIAPILQASRDGIIDKVILREFRDTFGDSPVSRRLAGSPGFCAGR